MSHYLASGWRQGLSFHPYFDPAWYMAQPGSGARSPVPLIDFLLAPPGRRNAPQAFADPPEARRWRAAGLCPHVELMAGALDRPAGQLNGLRSEGWYARDGGSARAYLAGRRRHRERGRRRIVFVGHDAGRAGAQMILLRLVEHAAASGLVEPFVILAAGGPLTDAYARTGHLMLPRPGEKAETVVRRLLDRIADEPPAGVVVSTVVIPDYVAAFARAGHPPDVLVHETADMYPVETQTAIAGHARRLIFGSRDTEARFRRRVPGVYGGDVLYTGTTLTANPVPEPDGDPVVIGCGTVTWRKGVDRFLDVARRTLAIVGDEIPVRFRWIGARVPIGDAGADFWTEYDADRLGLGDRFGFLDEVEDTAPLYARSSVMLCTSRADTFPGVVLEAMATGRPVIAFADSGGAPEALVGGAGIVVPYGDTSAMAATLARLLRDPEERRRIGERARARIADRFRFADYTADVLRPLVPGLVAARMEGTPMLPVASPMPPPTGAPTAGTTTTHRPAPTGDSLLIVVDGRDAEAALLALNLAAFLRRRCHLAILLCDGRAYAATARAAADIVLSADAGMLADARALGEQLGRAIDAFAVRRAILVGDLPAMAAATLAGRFIPSVLVPTHILNPHGFAEAALWPQAVVATTPALARSLADIFPRRPVGDLPLVPVGGSRIWTEAGSDRRAAADRLRTAIGDAGDRAAGFVVLGSGPPTLDGGIDLFLRSAERLAGPGAPLFVWICSPGTGDSPRWAALRRRIAASPRHRHVLLWDSVPSLEPAYEKANLFLSTAQGAALPLAAAGAIERGLPIVAFGDGGALPELLAEDAAAAQGLVPALDTLAAAALIGHLARTPTARSSLVDGAKRLSARLADMATWCDRIDRLAAGRAAAIAAEREDIATILADAEFDLEEYQGDADADRPAAVLRHVRTWRCGQAVRRPAPGVHPGLLTGPPGIDPYAAHVRAGRPLDRGRCMVIRPGESAAAIPESLRAALHIHLYHADQAEDLLRRVAANAGRCDLILTTDTAAKARTIEWAAASLGGRRVRILLLPNRGRDIGAFLTGLGPTIIGEYDVVGHVHGKKTEHKPRDLVEPWRERMLQFLLGDAHPMMDRILSAFAADPGLGLVFPDDPHALGWDMPASGGLPPDLRSNRPAALKLAARLGWDSLPDTFEFPAGSMFWARPAALRPLLDLGLAWDDYPPEPVEENATMLHAIERMFCIVAERTGHRVAASHVAGFPR